MRFQREFRINRTTKGSAVILGPYTCTRTHAGLFVLIDYFPDEAVGRPLFRLSQDW